MKHNEYHWHIPKNLNTDNFDFSWRPSVNEPPFMHEFGTQWQKTGGPVLIHDDAAQIKYESHQIAVALPDMTNWKIDPTFSGTLTFDFSWHPDASEEPFNYVFGNQFKTAEESDFITYKGDSDKIKYMHNQTAKIAYTPLDIIFLSNGETGEQERYDRLVDVAKRKVKWVKGVQGRENALRKAAELSSTEWFILFPGKLYADENFDFGFQPDRYISPKHYIFYAKNPINGLEYGHQAAVCYNRQLVLDTLDYGLDFTMSKPHDVVPVLSGEARYDCDKFVTWRTAFREAIKLKESGDHESLNRLDIWLNIGDGEFGEYSKMGAQDGIEYFTAVEGVHDELMKTFEWEWLSTYFENKYFSII